MDFVFVTGQPGSGKTLNTIIDVEKRAKEESRPVYYYGIDELTLDWHRMEEPEALESNPDAITPYTWYNCPDGSIIVIDEAHRIFKPHDKADAPHIKPLSTYRHRGFSMYFISQGPALVTSYIRDWVQPHIHYRRLFGRQKVLKYTNEWCIDAIRTKKISENAQIDKVLLDEKWYGVYKSSSQHNNNKRINRKVMLALILPIFTLPFFIWLGISKISGMADDGSGGAAVADNNGISVTGSPQNGMFGVDYQPQLLSDSDNIMLLYKPRIGAMPETAPAYDDLRKAKTWPKPQCLISKVKDTCKCYTQQATIMHDYPDALCREFAQNGYFDPTKEDKQPPEPKDSKDSQQDKSAPSLPASDVFAYIIAQSAGQPDIPKYMMTSDGQQQPLRGQ